MPLPTGQPPKSLLSRLYRQGAYRWLVLVAAAAVLGALWLFAGQVRKPGRAKHQWAVTASRFLVLAGGVFAARLILLSHEERIPVLLLRSGDTSKDSLRSHLELIAKLRRRGFEDVPIADIVMFIREQRYVPKKGIGMVIEVGSLADLAAIGGSCEGLQLTVLVPFEALKKAGTDCSDGENGRSPGFDLPGSVSLGVSFGEGCDPAECLGRAAQAGLHLLAKQPAYAMFADVGPDVKGLLREHGYTCVLDGSGFNRFGDEAYSVRLCEVTVLGRAKAPIFGLLLYIAMFRGAYTGWPLAAAGRLLGILPGEI
jgi:hypothetical protein